MKKLGLIGLFMVIAPVTESLAGDEIGTVVFEHGQYSSSAASAGKTFFYLSGGSKASSPGCATWAQGERWVINNDWPAAELQVNILISAKLSGSKVRVRGSNNCNVWSDTETVVDVYIVE